MRVRQDDLRPPYLQVASDLRDAIHQDKLHPGQRLPSIRELAEQYEVAPMTIQNAIGVLRDEGLVATVQGRGVFVADPLPEIEEQPSNGTNLAARLAQLEERVETTAGADPRVDELQRQVDTLRSQLIELYGRLGFALPDQDEPAKPNTQRRRRRHA